MENRTVLCCCLGYELHWIHERHAFIGDHKAEYLKAYEALMAAQSEPFTAEMKEAVRDN